MAADPSDSELAEALEEAEFAEAADHIAKAEEYAATHAWVKRRRTKHKRLRARRYADETEGEYTQRLHWEKLERHRTMPYPSSPNYSVYDPSDPRNNLWGQHSPMYVLEKQHMERIARDWFRDKQIAVHPVFDIESLACILNYSHRDLNVVESVTWAAKIRNGPRLWGLRVLHNPKINGERSVIFPSGDQRAYDSKHKLW